MNKPAPGYRKKILIASTNSDWAGAPIHVLTLVTTLQAKFDVFVVFGEDGPVRQEMLQRGVPSRVVPTLRSKISPIADLLSLLSLLKIVRSEQPALLHAHSSKAGMIARVVGYFLNVPCLYTVHGWGFGNGRARIQGAFVFFFECVLSRIPGSTYIFVSEADRRIGLEQLGIKSTRCLTIHNGVTDHGCRSAVDKSSAVIMAARVCYQKNHDLLLKSFEDCRTQFRLVLVGEGTDSTNFRRRVLANAPNKHELVECLGLSNHVPQLLARSGIFVPCSRYEGLPLSVIEAMCAGMPIVATDVGGVRELVEDGVNGFLVQAGDQAALKNCLDRLQEDTDLRVRMGQASRDRYVADFSDTRMADSVAQQYRKAIDAV